MQVEVMKSPSKAGAGAAVTTPVSVKVWGHKRTRTLTANGNVVTVNSGEVNEGVTSDYNKPAADDARPVRLSYAGLKGKGGDYASRLTVRQYPACAAVTPKRSHVSSTRCCRRTGTPRQRR